MKKILPGGIEADITPNETGGYDVNIILPPKTYYSDEEYLRDRYDKIYGALTALKKIGIFSGNSIEQKDNSRFVHGAGKPISQNNHNQVPPQSSSGPIKQAVKDAITYEAEKAARLYKTLSDYMKEHSDEEKIVIEMARELSRDANIIAERDNDKMGWGDLLDRWLFELGNYKNDTIEFGPNAKTTHDLKIQDGVQVAKTETLIDIEAGRTVGYVNHDYVYGVDQFFQDIKERNEVTAFLGSYHVHTSWIKNDKGGYTISYTVTNKTSWESGTRLRKAAPGSDVHQGIISNRKRGDPGIPLGGNLNEIWRWIEDIPNPGISGE